VAARGSAGATGAGGTPSGVVSVLHIHRRERHSTVNHISVSHTPERAEPAATQPKVVVIDTRAVWLLVGLVLAAVVVWLLVTRALDTLVLLFVAITFGEGIRPLVDWLEHHHIPRPVAVLSIYAAIAVIVLGLLFLLFAPLTRQLVDFVLNVPTYLQRAVSLLAEFQQRLSASQQAQQVLQAIQTQVSNLVSSAADVLIATPVLMADVAFKAIELYLMAFFWLTAATPLKAFVVGTFPPNLRPRAAEVIAELGYKLGGHVRAVAVNMVAIAVLSGAGLLVLGIPYPLLLAFVAGLAETLPLLGPWLAGGFAVLVTLFTGGTIQAGEVVGLYLLIHLIEGNTLVPYVTYRMTELNPLATIAAISAGGGMLGVVGAVLGVPVALVIQVLVVSVGVPALRHLGGTATRDDLRHPALP
jgi:predicted PurR-regulated permease PerM